MRVDTEAAVTLRPRLLGRSPAMRPVFAAISQMGQNTGHVLVLGENGTGKELVARAIHAASPRRDRVFMNINCAAYSPTLLESELFGHERGAFTGAVATRIGRFEAAAGGTALLDEIGDTSLHTQVKLLRVLQSGEIERVGSNVARRVDARIIVATHRNLAEMVGTGRFREDLYHRLRVHVIQLPPLRERAGDVRLIAETYLGARCRAVGKSVPGFSRDGLAALEAHSWPGNVRELEHTLERMIALLEGGEISGPLVLKCIDESLGTADETAAARPTYPTTEEDPPDLQSLEEMMIRRALKAARWQRETAARNLGWSRYTLWRRMKKYNITPHS